MAEFETEGEAEVTDEGVSLGDDLDQDFSPGAGTAESSQSVQTEEPKAEFDPMNADWIQLRDEEVPDEYKPLLKTARMFQSQTDRARNEAQTQAGASSQNAEALQARVTELEQRYGATPEKDPLTISNELLGQFGYAPGADGYDEANVVLGIAQAVTQPMMEQITTLQQQNAWMTQQLQGVQKSSQQVETDRAQAELDEAITDFGQDELGNNWDAVKALRGKINQRTGVGFTVSEALALVSPSAAEKSQQLRESGQQAIKTAQNGSRPSPGVTPPEQSGGPTNELELTADLQRLGFE